jgi:lysozyme
LRIPIKFLSAGAALLVGVATFEGFRDTAYPDIVGKQTIAFGTTEGVKAGDRVTVERGLVLLLRDVNTHSEGIKKCINGDLYQYEFDAFSSLAYNVGVGAVCNSSIPRKIAAKQYDAACRTILDFDKVRDCSKPKVWSEARKQWVCPLVPVRGLTIRRNAEYQQCMGATK